ncbi:MAG: TCP-1/cpn60 chaperonin family protein [Anaerolineaceae bacterium]|nr:TCP-1/cpn60 chaperonin family protein [Anaerolineaceae bacterium]
MNNHRRSLAAFGVTHQPQTYQGMLAGVSKLTSAIRPTLGPFPRMVVLSSSRPGKAPELLDDGGLIARRLVQVLDRDEDIGVMYLRHLLWRIREDCGDGTATAAVMFEEIFKQGIRHIVNGGHAMPLRRYLEKGARLVLAELKEIARPVQGRDKVMRIAKSMCYDPAMAELLGEIFDTIGEYGHFELRESQGRGLEYKFTTGSYWEGPLHSKLMINQPAEKRAVFENAGVVVTDFAIEEPQHLVHVLVEARKAGITSLLMICNSISDPCLGFLMAESTRKFLSVITVKTPSQLLEEQSGGMEDIAVLTGAKPLTLHAGETLESVTPNHFGQARLVWADHQFFGIQGGQGNPRTIRQHVSSLKKLHASLEDGKMRSLVRSRIGNMLGGSAILFIGGATEVEINVNKDLAERAAESIRGAIAKGILPGGGAALLVCKPALQTAMDQANDPDEIAAYSILLRAMDIPLRTISANAGISPEDVFAEIKQAGPDHGYDVRKRGVFSIDQTEIFDTAYTVQEAAYRSIVGAALLLTVDVLVHHKKRETVMDT